MRGIRTQHKDLLRPYAAAVQYLVSEYKYRLDNLDLKELQDLQTAITAVTMKTKRGNFYRSAVLLEPYVKQAIKDRIREEEEDRPKGFWGAVELKPDGSEIPVSDDDFFRALMEMEDG